MGKSGKPASDKQLYTLKKLGHKVDSYLTEGQAGKLIEDYKKYHMPEYEFAEVMKEINSEEYKTEKETRRKLSEISGFSDYDYLAEDIINEHNRKMENIRLRKGGK